jgi:hypothetical protein
VLYNAVLGEPLIFAAVTVILAAPAVLAGYVADRREPQVPWPPFNGCRDTLER